jgi:hypothetical protein
VKSRRERIVFFLVVVRFLAKSWVLGLSAVFRILARLGKIGVLAADAFVFLAMRELAHERFRAALLRLVGFDCAFLHVIVFFHGHLLHVEMAFSSVAVALLSNQQSALSSQ